MNVNYEALYYVVYCLLFCLFLHLRSKPSHQQPILRLLNIFHLLYTKMTQFHSHKVTYTLR